MSQDRNLSGCQVFRASDLPSDWSCVQLGDRIELAYGKALTGSNRKPGNIAVYGSNGQVGVHNSALVGNAGILVGRKGSIGAVHYAPSPFWAIDTVYYVIQKAEDDLRFVYWLLDYLKLARLNAATGVPGLSRRDVYAIRGAFPRLDEQEAIARILDTVKSSMAWMGTACDRARGLRSALLQQLIVKGTRGEPQKKTVIGEIPKSWSVLAVSNVVHSLQYGLSVPMAAKGELPILRMGNIQDGGVSLSDIKYVNLPSKLVAPYLIKRGTYCSTEQTLKNGSEKSEFIAMTVTLFSLHI